MPNEAALHRSFVLFFDSEGARQAYLTDTQSRGTSNALVSATGWVMVTNIRSQVAAAVDAGGTIVTAGNLMG